jgi:hypothetical protein
MFSKPVAVATEIMPSDVCPTSCWPREPIGVAVWREREVRVHFTVLLNAKLSQNDVDGEL